MDLFIMFTQALRKFMHEIGTLVESNIIKKMKNQIE